MIQIEKLKKVYDNGHEALKNINLIYCASTKYFPNKVN